MDNSDNTSNALHPIAKMGSRNFQNALMGLGGALGAGLGGYGGYKLTRGPDDNLYRRAVDSYTVEPEEAVYSRVQYPGFDEGVMDAYRAHLSKVAPMAHNDHMGAIDYTTLDVGRGHDEKLRLLKRMRAEGNVPIQQEAYDDLELEEDYKRREREYENFMRGYYSKGEGFTGEYHSKVSSLRRAPVGNSLRDIAGASGMGLLGGGVLGYIAAKSQNYQDEMQNAEKYTPIGAHKGYARFSENMPTPQGLSPDERINFIRQMQEEARMRKGKAERLQSALRSDPRL